MRGMALVPEIEDRPAVRNESAGTKEYSVRIDRHDMLEAERIDERKIQPDQLVEIPFGPLIRPQDIAKRFDIEGRRLVDEARPINARIRVADEEDVSHIPDKSAHRTDRELDRFSIVRLRRDDHVDEFARVFVKEILLPARAIDVAA